MAGDRIGFEPQPAVELPDLSPSPADTYANPVEIVVDSKGRVTSVTEGGGGGGAQTIVCSGSYGTEQDPVVVPSTAAGDPRFTLGYAIMACPDDGRTYTITRFAVRLGAFDSNNLTISDSFTVGLKKVPYTVVASNISTLSYGTGDGGRAVAAKTATLSAVIAPGSDVYVWASGAPSTISAGPISWEVTYTIT